MPLGRCLVRPSDLEEDLALALARLEVLVALGRVVEREGHVDGHLELAVLEPAEDLVGAVVELGARARVVEQLGPADEGALADEAEHGEGGHGARGVAEGDEDAALRERVDRDVQGVLADAIDDSVAALAAGHLLDPRGDVDGLVVLVARARHLGQHDELVDAARRAHVLLALGHGADDLVAHRLGHLRRPLAGAAAHAVDEHPLAGHAELRVRVRREVVRGEALHGQAGGHVEPDAVRHAEELAGGHGRVLAVGTEDRVGHTVAHLEALGRGLGRHGGDLAAALLPGNERQVACVQAATVVPGHTRHGGRRG
eukprot:scaffold89881_cov55-Phaeocystis_antarctica.AAC.1